MLFSATGRGRFSGAVPEVTAKLANRFDNMANVVFGCQSQVPALAVSGALAHELTASPPIQK
jgi:hypothetical protein